MNLLKFIELQQKETPLHKISIQVKISLILAPPILVSLLRIEPPLSYVIYLTLILSLEVSIALGLKAPRYPLDIFAAFALLFVLGGIVYSLRGKSIISFFAERKFWFITLLYIAYSLAFILSTTSVEQLEILLSKIKLPKRWIIATIIAYNLIPAMYNEARQVLMHQAARGLQLSKNPFIRLRQLVALYIPMIFVSLLRGEYLEQSLRARGY
ncbi:MAG: energy-coupling factor transporter transmembrane component T [Candidatus Korarchaeota archaeon]|nr:energy-coupling factor transporter transmembrane protein EcfT [Thermoproteota archaeon]MCR8462942.1 energy-coupling factor transporter transmembrane protein EcfT [Thermoproteota archaeon]MCR8471143.1 energy-coupling factor transporter transmembrane protein EcfT [Thermoproteota archaeon]MCR8473178.1 energy-coupling factor transporter transmembrane protein EcfT [Thermoproteota archaeon]MCR8489023.1 energy-coupling factor transporter transmembrane protein EcfT [Thermoproteota archaeon]